MPTTVSPLQTWTISRACIVLEPLALCMWPVITTRWPEVSPRDAVANRQGESQAAGCWVQDARGKSEWAFDTVSPSEPETCMQK